MRIGRIVVIPSILALSVAGAVLTGSGISAAVTHAPSAHVQASASSAGPDVYYHG